MIIDGIDYLFHYTSIENLALILKNRTIRLNPLSKMDDLQEVKTRGLKDFGEYFFVSSWTEEDSESIPMWNMYTRMDAGVRIGLPKNPFVRHGTSVEGLKTILDKEEVNEELQDSFLDVAELFDKRAISPQAFSGNILYQVRYTDDRTILEPMVLTSEDGKLIAGIDSIGLYKNTYWAFQKEWRYLMFFFPVLFAKNASDYETEIDMILHKIINRTMTAPFDYFDLNIRADAMDVMRITPSPRMTAGNRVILDALLAQYNPKAKIVESELKGLV